LLADRVNLSVSIDVRAIAKVLLVPFTIAFLLCYSGWVHTRRLLPRFHRPLLGRAVSESVAQYDRND
jgi:hypothetical protein